MLVGNPAEFVGGLVGIGVNVWFGISVASVNDGDNKLFEYTGKTFCIDGGGIDIPW